MQGTQTNEPVGEAKVGPGPAFNVLIAYEDVETGKLAKRTYDLLVAQLGRDLSVDNQLWKFDVLRIAGLRRLATADAAAADLVVISCHGEDLPPHVKDWIQSWLHDADSPLALVALFGQGGEGVGRSEKAREYLAEVARQGGMEFFAQPVEWLDDGKQSGAMNADPTDLFRPALLPLPDRMGGTQLFN